MFGIGVNKYQLGHDLFNTKKGDNTVVFTDGSYVTDTIYYDGQSGDIYSISDEAFSEDDVLKRSQYADDIIKVSNDIITYNLINELENTSSEDLEK